MYNPKSAFILGAVAYDPKVVTIWDGFREFFLKNGLDFDYVLYHNYERQVYAHFKGEIHTAWNSPLAWLMSEGIAAKLGKKARAVAMRDTDQGLHSIFVVNAKSGIKSVADLKGKNIAFGAKDSPQATMIPRGFLEGQGLAGSDYHPHYYDVLVGKHGDHIGGERDAARALMQGEVDAAAMISGNHLLFTQEGILHNTEILTKTPDYDHCNFTVLDHHLHPETDRFVSLLLAMRYDDAEVKHLLDLEGLKKWLPGRTSHYKPLADAIRGDAVTDGFINAVAISAG